MSCFAPAGRSGNVLGSNGTTPKTRTGMPQGVRPVIEMCTHLPSRSRHNRAGQRGTARRSGQGSR